MSALPDSEPVLPFIPRERRNRLGLVTIRDLARQFEMPVAVVRRWLNNTDAPGPVAQTAEPWYGRHEMLYNRCDVLRFVHSDAMGRGRNQALRYAPKPAVVGTKTPTAGRPYVWRDPRRWTG